MSLSSESVPFHGSGCLSLFSRQFLCRLVLAVCLGLGTSLSAQTSTPAETAETTNASSEATSNGETIVSEKDEVDLVEDSSIAEAVKRRPDLSFANVTIDGESSGVSLSSLNAEDVESVEVMKAVTPDLDADSRGGSISLRTKPTYNQQRRVTSVEASLSYDSLDSQMGGRGRLTFAGPLNEARTWGARASLSYSNSPYGSQTLYQDWRSANIDSTPHFVLRDTGYGTYRRTLESFNVDAALDFKFSDTLSFYTRASVQNRDYETAFTVLKYRFFRGDYVAADETTGSVENADIRNSIWLYNTRSDETEAAIGGTYETEKLLVDFRLTYKDDEVEYLDYFTADWVQDDVSMDYSFDDPRFPTTEITDGKLLNDPEAYEFEDLVDREFLGAESDLIGAINARWSELFDRPGMFLKAGYKTRARENNRYSEYNLYDAYDGSFTVADVLSDVTEPNVLNGRYSLEMIPDPVAAREFFRNNQEDFTFNERRTRENSDPNTFVANEQVDSLYGMFNFEWGQWRTLIGVRNEATTVDFIGNEVVLDVNDEGETVYVETNPVKGDSSYNTVFPNAHFRYRWTDRITLIGSYTKTIDRPSYTYLVPYRRVNLEEKEIEEGNPLLRPTLFTNYDLSVDLTLPRQGMVSLELFNRSVEDFVFSAKQIVPSGIYQGFELERYENSSSADITGASITWRQSLDQFSLPSGLSLNANFTTQKSEIEYPARPGEILPLTELPDNELKLTLSYQNDKFFAQVRYAYEDLVPTRIADNAAEDIYVVENSQIDLSMTYQLRKNVRLFADVQNLTNEAYYDRYEGSPDRPSSFRYLPWSMSSGVRVEL